MNQDETVVKVTEAAESMIALEIQRRREKGANYCSMLALYPDGKLLMHNEASPYYSKSEYLRMPGAPIIIWEEREITKAVSDDEREHGTPFGWMCNHEIFDIHESQYGGGRDSVADLIADYINNWKHGLGANESEGWMTELREWFAIHTPKDHIVIDDGQFIFPLLAEDVRQYTKKTGVGLDELRAAVCDDGVYKAFCGAIKPVLGVEVGSEVCAALCRWLDARGTAVWILNIEE